MTESMVNLIIGAVISLVASLLTVITTNIFQLKRDDKARKWLLEDQKLEHHREVVRMRLREAEQFIEISFDVFIKMFIYEMDISQTAEVNSEKSNRYIAEMEPVKNAFVRSHAGILNSDDQELIDISNEFLHLVESEAEASAALEEKIKKHTSYDKENERIRIQQYYFTGAKLRGSLIKRIDTLSVNG